MATKRQQYKDQAFIAALVAMAFAQYQTNRALVAHVKSCEESSKNTRRVLWLVLSSVVGEVVLKFINMVHFGS